MQVLSSGNIASLATLSSCISATGSSSEDKCSNKHQIVIAYLAFTGHPDYCCLPFLTAAAAEPLSWLIGKKKKPVLKFLSSFFVYIDIYAAAAATQNKREFHSLLYYSSSTMPGARILMV